VGRRRGGYRADAGDRDALSDALHRPVRASWILLLSRRASASA
jgi:hypothetical protein